jgi:G:T-mismatch repair DNA endonuclease (very short patch repair protein)
MRERDIERKYRKNIEAEGGLCLKLSSPGYSGLPDRMVLMPEGVIWFVEFKSKTGVLSPRQERVIEKLNAMGFRVDVERPPL